MNTEFLEVSTVSGHNKWSKIQHKKGAKDAKRGQAFSKLIKELTVVARAGGGSPEANPRLRMLIQKAKGINMPNENVQRAIKRGTGEIPGVTYEEQTYEGFGPGGVAFLVDALTDNKNRTVADVRNIFSKGGGNLAGGSSVAWMFHLKGVITVAKEHAKEDNLFMLSTEAGAEDFSSDEEDYQITCDPSNTDEVREILEKNNIQIKSIEIEKVASNLVELSKDDTAKVIKLIETLEENEDVQNVWTNINITDAMMASLGE